MSKDNVGEDMICDAGCAREHTKQRITRLEEQDEQLLPMIPDEITLDLIIPKLPWETFHVLSSISSRWKHAIQSHQVYEARARSSSTETLAVVNLTLSESKLLANYKRAIALYSVRDKRFWKVPPIPQLEQFPMFSQCISLGGKLYVLGGMKQQYPFTDPRIDVGSDEVYMLDLAGQKPWRTCSRMQQGRHQFGCGVLDEKIYVFGGTSLFQPVRESEVYDPKVDAWSQISPMPSLRFKHRVTAVGEELVVHGGEHYQANWFEGKRGLEQAHGCPGTPDYVMGEGYLDVDGLNLRHPLSHHIQEAVSFEIYNPAKDEWRELKRSERQILDIVSTAQGKLCAIDWGTIHVHGTANGSSWKQLHSFSFNQILPAANTPVSLPFDTAVVDGELLGVVHWLNEYQLGYESCLVQSRGFCSEKIDLLWQKAQWSSPFEQPFVMKYIMCPIHL